MSKEEAGIAAASGTQLLSESDNIQDDVTDKKIDIFKAAGSIQTTPTCGECLHFLQHDMIGQAKHHIDELGAAG